MINRIEDNMVKADEAVEVGVQELPQAVKNKRAARKVNFFYEFKSRNSFALSPLSLSLNLLYRRF